MYALRIGYLTNMQSASRAAHHTIKGLHSMLQFTSEQLAQMNKGQLREACRAFSIGYNSLNNDGMRAALAEHASDYVAPQGAPVAPLAQVEPRVLTDVPVAVVAPTLPVPPAAPKVPKVVQPEANGVKRPKPGTICAEIWDWCDRTQAGTPASEGVAEVPGVRPEAKALRAALPARDDTTKTVQFYRWRKFNGIQGR